MQTALIFLRLKANCFSRGEETERWFFCWSLARKQRPSEVLWKGSFKATLILLGIFWASFLHRKGETQKDHQQNLNNSCPKKREEEEL